jgi:hypothetical protein
MRTREKKSVLHGMMAAVNTFKRLNVPTISLNELAVHIAGYADTLAEAWNVDLDPAGLESIIREVERVLMPAPLLHSEVANRPENNN